MSSKLNITQTSEILGVSNATIRNWIRHNYLSPIEKENNVLFDYKEVQTLKENINNGNIVRLNKRANKRNSAKTFIPKEYTGENNIDAHITSISDYIEENSLSVNESIFLLSLNLLYKEKLVFSSSLDVILTFKESYYKNIYLLRILEDFFQSIKDFSKEHHCQKLLEQEIPLHNDILGLIYQSIKSEGEKAKQGSYYTPKQIVDEIIKEYVKENFKILDPCCGTGQFLLNACVSISNPNNIYGFDIDPLAVFIAKINLIIKFKALNFNPNIFEKNTLLEIDSSSLFKTKEYLEFYDLVLTNPPWGLHFENGTLNTLKSIYPHIKSQESFSYFLSISIEMLSENGILSFILPESILNIKVHKDIRNTILKNTSILKIIKLGRAFTNVFTNVIRIDLMKKSPDEKHKIKVITDSKYFINQARFLSNPDFIFDIDVNDYDNEIIKKAFKLPYSTLKKNADWALGIVTGDNKKFIHTIKTDGCEEIYKGKDVNKYVLSSASNYIKFEPDKFQQVAPVEKYRAEEKLIYKFISNKLVFAYDDKQKLTVNSANILIPKVNNYPNKVILALLNSSLYQFIYLKKFNTIKVLRGNLEELPLPVFSEAIYKELIALVDKVLLKKIDSSVIDDYVMDLFQITEAEKKHIMKSI